MPDPVPPAPNPTPEPSPSIKGYIKPWELAKIVFGALATGGIGYEAVIPLLQALASSADVWLINPAHVETVRLVIGAAIAVLSGVFMTRRYLRQGVPPEKLAGKDDARTHN